MRKKRKEKKITQFFPKGLWPCACACVCQLWQGAGHGDTGQPCGFCVIPLVTRGPLCAGLLVTDNLILMRIIIVCVHAGNSHIFKEICRGI